MIGQIISHYKILEKLGEGGMGIVYKAQDTRLDRVVALKFLPLALTADAMERERFYQEARAASQLMHPNVTAIFEINETEGQVYLAMEHVDGKTLKKLILEENPVSLKRGLDIAIQLCAGLSAAHEKGIVHRDIKSDNILVSNKGEVKITDFGLAKLKGSSTLTKTGSTLGTAAYMSPEQARGEDVDARSDIFSAGVVLYELFTGKLPFRGEHQAAILYSLINEEPLPLARFNENITPELQHIVSKSLAKEKEDRYQHADEMLADLRRERKTMEYARSGYVTQSSVSIQPAGLSPTTSTISPVKSPQKTIIISGILVLLLIIGGYLGYEKFGKSQPTVNPGVSKIAVLPFENLGGTNREYFADGLTDEIRTKLSGLSGLTVIARASSVQYKKTTKSVLDIGNELNVGYLLQGTIRWEEGDSLNHRATRLMVNPTLVKVADGTQVWSESFEGTLSGVFEIQSDISQRVAQTLELALNASEQRSIESKPTGNAEAYDYFLRGQQFMRFPSPENLKQGIEMFHKAVNLDQQFAEAYAYLCRGYAFWNFSFQTSDSILGLAKKSLDRVLELEPKSFHAYWAQGYYYYYAFRDYNNALKYFSLALQLQPNNADIISSIAYVKRRQGNFSESLDLLTRSCELDPKSWDIWFELAFLDMVMRDYKSADEHYKRALLVYGKGSTIVASLHSLAVYSMQGDLKAAHEIFLKESDETKSWNFRQRNFQYNFAEGNYIEAKNDLARSVLAAPDIDSSVYYSALAALVDKTARHNDALAYYDTARALAQEAVNAHPNDYSAHESLGNILAHLGQKQQAIEEGRKAVELMPMEKDAFQSGPDAIYSLAVIYALVGEPDAAIDKLEQVVSVPSIYSSNFIKTDPELESLYNLPRFQKLIEKYKVQG